MKDKIIMSAISKIYFALVSFFIFIFSLFIIGFFLLQNGLYLDKLSFSNVFVKQLSLRWENGLNVAVKEIVIKDTQKKKQSTKPKLKKYLTKFTNFLPLLHSVSVEDISYAQFHATLNYNKDSINFLEIKAPAQALHATFMIEQPYFKISIDEYNNTKESIYAHGDIIFDMDKVHLYTKINLDIQKSAALTLYSLTDTQKVTYKIKSKKSITHLNELLSMLPMPKAIDFWANKAIDAQSADLQQLYGFVTFDKAEDAYKNLYAKITLQKLNYTYNPKLDAIHTQTTDLEFKDGILYIYPRNAYSYGMYLDKSWLKIDLSPHKEYLTLYLDFDGKLNKDVLRILQTYKIKVPFLQKTGKTKTDLKIGVNLRTIAVDAHGKFYTKKALFEYLGLDIDIKDALIKLDNYDVDIPKMNATYKNIARAGVKAHYNAKKGLGDIDFRVQKLQLHKEAKLVTKKPFHTHYLINPKGDKLILDKSYWNIKGFELLIEPSELALNLKTLQLTLEPTAYQFADIANGYIEGSFDIKKMQLHATLDLLHFSYQGIKSTQTDTEFQIVYDKKLSIKSFDNIYFTINGSPYKIKKLEALLDEEAISIKHTMLYIGKYIQAKIYAKHKFNTDKAYITLNKFLLINPETKHTLYKNSKIPLVLSFDKEKIQLDAKELRAHFSSTSQYWKLELDSLNILSKKSDFLKRYMLNNGSIVFTKQNNDNIIRFRGKTKYKYALLTTNQHKNISEYLLNGYISKSLNVYININNKINIKIANPMKISLHNAGINLHETISFVENLQKNSSDNDNSDIVLFFKAKDTFIQLDDERAVLCDSINLQYFNKITTAQVIHRNGKAGFKLKENTFHLYGSGFNDVFMQKLFTISKFKGGNLDFSINGTLEAFNGIFFVKNTTMLDYAILNNVLAFINTVPSLATFSLPGYNQNGLFVKNAYMRFQAKDKHYKISDLYIGSKELTMLGKGVVDLNSDTIDLTMNLKTDLGSNLSKVPLVGYILLDGQNISTTLKVFGPLKDPKVKTMIAQDIAVAPLNIILRTLKLPYKLINDSIESTKGKK
ncbi:MAG: AsmA-like C-terminal domain-containing protein [Sulfurimonas sp.]